jgi:hypothetical protein
VRRRIGALSLVAGLVMGLAGCGLFGGGEPDAPAPISQTGAEGAAGAGADAVPQPGQPAGPFAQGVLKTAANRAPAGSAAQLLATLADDMGWENEVNQDLVLREAIGEGAFEDRVEPRLLGLYFRKGFSVLPSVGEGHEFTRDSVVRGPVANRRFFSRSREPVRIIFLDQADNIVIIYPKNAGQPQVFNRITTSTVALRESRLEQYLN